MKHLYSVLLTVLAVSVPSHGALFTDLTSDTSLGTTDIKTVQVTHSDTQLTFRIDLNKTAKNYLRYLVSIDSKNGGSPGGPGSWETSIRTTQANDYFLVGCLDGQLQGTLYSWSGGIWLPNDITSDVAIGSSYFTFNVNRQSLGLNNGATIKFDVFTSDGAMNSLPWDALSSTAPITGVTYSPGTFFTYEVTSVPEPANYALFSAVGLIGVGTFHKLRRRSTLPSKR